MCMPEKVRVNLVISKRNHEALKALTQDVPGLSMSNVVDELIADAVPMLQAMLSKAEELPKLKHDEQERRMLRLVANQMVERMFGTQEEFIHTLMRIGGAAKEAK